LLRRVRNTTSARGLKKKWDHATIGYFDKLSWRAMTLDITRKTVCKIETSALCLHDFSPVGQQSEGQFNVLWLDFTTGSLNCFLYEYDHLSKPKLQCSGLIQKSDDFYFVVRTSSVGGKKGMMAEGVCVCMYKRRCNQCNQGNSVSIIPDYHHVGR